MPAAYICLLISGNTEKPNKRRNFFCLTLGGLSKRKSRILAWYHKYGTMLPYYILILIFFFFFIVIVIITVKVPNVIMNQSWFFRNILIYSQISMKKCIHVLTLCMQNATNKVGKCVKTVHRQLMNEIIIIK